MAIEKEVCDVSMGSPHLVLLGAGASRAAFQNGEGTGRQLPLMADFSDIVPVKEILQEAGFDPASNFEASYSAIAVNPEMADTRARLEEVVYKYFASLQLPEEPTLYDHLILGLRGKDVIATFNWDPFLMQAARRSDLRDHQIPKMVFLHGSVFGAFCTQDKVMGPAGGICSRCGIPFEPMRLLYPVADKKYDQQPGIARGWKFLDHVLDHSFWFTVFGYSAPVSDANAVNLLQSAWSRLRKKELAQVEIIDIQPEKALEQAWEGFTYSHHYEVHKTFYDSWIARHPRRTIEAYHNQFIEAKIIQDNRPPWDADWDELRSWFEPLLEVEEAAAK